MGIIIDDDGVMHKVFTKDEVIAMFTELKSEIEGKIENADFMSKRIQEILQSPDRIAYDDDLQSGYNLCLVDTCNSIQQKIEQLKGNNDV